MLVSLIAACDNDAQVVSENLSKDADNFKINRRIVFYNGYTNTYMLEIDGLCSIGSGKETNSVTVTCKDGNNGYKKHFLGLSRDVTFFVEQLDNASVSASRYKVIFKPSTIIPDVEIR